MPTAELASAREHGSSGPAGAWRERRWAWPTLALILLGGLVLRLWGVRQGLPFVYNLDEADHFVPHAVKMFQDGSLDPHYFANPPAFTYLLHFLFLIAYGGGHGAEHALAHDPTGVYTLARVAAAVLGTGAVWLLYLLGSRLFGRAVGLLAAAVEAVAFLPVFYAHLALNDVPTLAPLTLSLLGSAGVLRRGRLRDHLLAGIGLGLACATKYTAGIALLPYIAAAIASHLQRTATRKTEPATAGPAPALAGAAVMGLSAVAAFVLANPYSVLDFSAFHSELVHQSSQSAEAQGKLGSPKQGGVIYYLWSLTWGLGWVPALAALGGAVAIWWRERALGWMLVPATVLFLIFMGTQGRYFGRWLMPILPLVCLLAAFAGAQALGALLRHRQAGPHDLRFWVGLRDRSIRGAPPSAAALVVVAGLMAQGLIYSVHSGLVLAKTDTRTLTRTWMLGHIPRGSRIVVEPVSPDNWAGEAPGLPGPPRCGGHQWCKYPSTVSRIDASGAITASTRRVGVESYVRTLAPELVGYYVSNGYCWVVTGSTQADRALVRPAEVALADAYYVALAQRGRLEYAVTPLANRKVRPSEFNFDWSFDYYPLAYSRPGPEMRVYRLSGGRCRT